MCRASLVAQLLKNLPVMQTWVQSLGREDPLDTEMTTHSSIAWRIPWTEEPDQLHTSHRVAGSPTCLKQLSTHAHLVRYVSLPYTVFDAFFVFIV